jgi:membrane protease YdiL (CAAX protease family)
MTKAPGDSSEPSSRVEDGRAADRSATAYLRPWLATAIAGGAVVVTLVLVWTSPGMRDVLARWPGWAMRLFDLVVLSAPLVIAVVLAGRLAADGIGRATGIRRWTWWDATLGLCAGLVARAVTELVAPTAGRLLGPFDVEVTAALIADAAVLVVGVVLVTPVVEELFFRGVMVRALSDGFAGAGRAVAGTVAVAVSSVVFVLLHIVPSGTAPAVGVVVGTLAVGIGCGILTVLTGRLCGAVIAHVLFNASGVALLIW